MLFDLPDDATLYRALLDRDTAYDGRAWVGVRSTGVFCQLNCPARKPKPENCTFFDSIAGCLEAGFRPCKRCKPLHARAWEADYEPLLAALDEDPTRRWVEGDIAALGYDPSTVRRVFKRQFGMTFLEMARLTRLRESFEALADGARVIDAQQAAGYESPAAFRAAFARHLGMPPSALRPEGRLKADWFETRLGPMIAVADATHLHLLEFIDRKALPAELRRLWSDAKGELGAGRTAITDQVEAELGRFFDGQSARFETPLAFHGASFAREVWQALTMIPPGETRTYGALAKSIGRPSATRAVARANGANQLAILVPCHRVIGADGSLTGYGGGLWRKQELLTLEARYREGGDRS
ncbi:MAG: trifunctional transcriptional activator/DNA repair protein Ada/methylated-DNA--[protein]-cysteine S-methyltransferase [Pseudomonadota bacterium]